MICEQKTVGSEKADLIIAENLGHIKDNGIHESFINNRGSSDCKIRSPEHRHRLSNAVARIKRLSEACTDPGNEMGRAREKAPPNNAISSFAASSSH